MSDTASDIENTVISFITKSKKMRDDFDAQMPLYADGVGLDSLETAELSALLEDNHGTDPYSAGDSMPQTLADILAFYDAVPSEA